MQAFNEYARDEYRGSWLWACGPALCRLTETRACPGLAPAGARAPPQLGAHYI
jgi:hypothetical protein